MNHPAVALVLAIVFPVVANTCDGHVTETFRCGAGDECPEGMRCFESLCAPACDDENPCPSSWSCRRFHSQSEGGPGVCHYYGEDPFAAACTSSCPDERTRCVAGYCTYAPTCDDDKECGDPSYECVAHRCLGPDPSGRLRCEADGSCPESQVCDGMWCWPECAIDATCDAGTSCEGDASCPAPCTPRQELCGDGVDQDCNGVVDDCGHACGSDADCPDSVCYDGFCALG